MRRKNRLRRSRDIQRVRFDGQAYAHPLLVLIEKENTQQDIRIGVVTGRRIGNAVIRNRIKRRVRASMQHFFEKIKPGRDILILTRKPIGEADYPTIEGAIEHLLVKAALIKVLDE